MVEEEVVPGDMVMTTIALDLHPTHHIWEVEGGDTRVEPLQVGTMIAPMGEVGDRDQGLQDGIGRDT